MELSIEQKTQIAQWVKAGDNLSTIQKRLVEELGISMTYMDVRFLVDDLDLSLVDTKKAPDPSEKKIEAEIQARKEAATGTGGGLVVDVDKVVQPGALISGTVTFSDGETAQWMIDQMGRPSVIPRTEGYRPSEEDILSFQTELSRVLQQQGF